MALAFLIGTAVAWDNGVARTPPLGYSNWNNFHNNINSSLFIETASMFADASAFPPLSTQCQVASFILFLLFHF